MKRNVRTLFFLLCFCWLPRLGFAQKHVITRPSTRPKTEQKSRPQANDQAVKPKTSSPRRGKKLTPEQQQAVSDLMSNMVTVEGGAFIMGATEEQKRSGAYLGFFTENLTHHVTLSTFRISKYEVTQQLWRAVMGYNLSSRKGDDLPATNVNWEECQTFISKLNQLTGLRFRLPTEAEWEFAARGGNLSRGYIYAGSDSLNDVSWYDKNSGGQLHPVGMKKPNELGLYDMSGNAMEWCQDWFGDYSLQDQTNPQGPATGDVRVVRGGDYDGAADDCRVSDRGYVGPSSRGERIGLRLAL